MPLACLVIIQRGPSGLSLAADLRGAVFALRPSSEADVGTHITDGGRSQTAPSIQAASLEQKRGGCSSGSG